MYSYTLVCTMLVHTDLMCSLGMNQMQLSTGQSKIDQNGSEHCLKLFMCFAVKSLKFDSAARPVGLDYLHLDLLHHTPCSLLTMNVPAGMQSCRN